MADEKKLFEVAQVSTASGPAVWNTETGKPMSIEEVLVEIMNDLKQIKKVL